MSYKYFSSKWSYRSYRLPGFLGSKIYRFEIDISSSFFLLYTEHLCKVVIQPLLLSLKLKIIANIY